MGYYKIKDRLGWKRMVSTREWHALQLSHLHPYASWDVDVSTSRPPAVVLTHARGEGESSKEVAIRFDDVSKGRFYYRDVTSDGIPFVHEGDIYSSYWHFQYVSDAIHFAKLFKGIDVPA